MRRQSITRLLVWTAVSLAAAGAATVQGQSSPGAKPVPLNLQASTAPATCAQHPEVLDCTGALAKGMVLFTWTCPGCDPNWFAIFVVNGHPAPRGDINLARTKLAALTVRPDQFKPKDCVAIKIFNPGNAFQHATGKAVCLEQVLAKHPATPAPGVAAAGATPATKPTPAPAPVSQPAKAVQGSAVAATVTQPAPSQAATGAAPAPGSKPVTAVQGSAVAAPVTQSPAKPVATGVAPAMTSTNKQGGTGMQVSVEFVPPPSGLSSTQDLKVCSAHGGVGGSLACYAKLPAGALALVWTCNNCKVIGYHLYRVDMGQHALLASNDAYVTDKSVTLALLDPPTGGFNDKCYAVSSYTAQYESNLSKAYCAGSGSVLGTMVIYPRYALHWRHSRISRTGVLASTNPADPPVDTYALNDNPPGGGSSATKPAPVPLTVGYVYEYHPNNLGDSYRDYYDRLGLYYDLSSLSGKTVTKAVIQMVAKVSDHDFVMVNGGMAPGRPGPQTCVAFIDKGTDHWWENNDLNSSVSYLSPGRIMGPNISIDVTSAIQGWLGSGGAASNFGFILRGDNENDLSHGNRSDVCLTTFEAGLPPLSVIYH